jgi:multiple sugar transport system permease protein
MYLIFKQSELLDTRLALIIANTASALPMTVWLLYSYFSQIPVIYEEAAWVDGCSRWQAIRYILLPLSLPGIITAGLFAFITAWGDIVYANALITSPALRTLPQALTDFRDLYKTTWETQMAASMITIIPPLLIFIAIQKHLIRGLNRQAGQM